MLFVPFAQSFVECVWFNARMYTNIEFIQSHTVSIGFLGKKAKKS